jgi:hypothetical protein
LNESLQQAFDSATIPVPILKDYYENDYRNKSNKVLNKLDVAIDALKDMKDIMKDSNFKEPYIADLPIPPASLLEEEEEPTVAKKPAAPVVEGFENVRDNFYFRL